MAIDSEMDVTLTSAKIQHFSKQDTPCKIVPILTKACAQSKIYSIMSAHVVSPGMNQNHPQTMTTVPEQLEETYT